MRFLILILLTLILNSPISHAQNNVNTGTPTTQAPPMSPEEQKKANEGQKDLKKLKPQNVNLQSPQKSQNDSKPQTGSPNSNFEGINYDNSSGSTEYKKQNINIIKNTPIVVKKNLRRHAKFYYAIMKISFPLGRKRKIGTVKINLYLQFAGQSVDNFIKLAEGKKFFIDPKTKKKVKRPFYNGLTFHRVIRGYLIQGGDPVGSGYGGPGFNLPFEPTPLLKFDRPGVVAMANASQFFITLRATPALKGKNTIIGQVVDGMPIIEAIGKTKTNRDDRPRRKVIIKEVAIQSVY